MTRPRLYVYNFIDEWYYDLALSVLIALLQPIN